MGASWGFSVREMGEWAGGLTSVLPSSVRRGYPRWASPTTLSWVFGPAYTISWALVVLVWLVDAGDVAVVAG
jgi:hypothetical protein